MKHNKHILFLLLGTCLGFLPSYAETVYFKNKAVWDYNNNKIKWGAVYIHYWGDGITGTEWGNSPMMEYIGNDWWKYDIPANGGTYGFICKSESGDEQNWRCNDVTNQTGDVACYFTEGGKDKLGFTDIPNSIYYYNTNNWEKVYVHLWSSNGNDNSIDATTWGQLADLKDEEDGWWSAPIVSTGCSCLFASSASGADQTANLQYNSTFPYYKDGEWYASKKTRRTMAFSEGALTNWWRQRMTTADDEESTQHTQLFETAVTEGEFGIQECKNHVVEDQLHWWWVSTPTTITKDTTIDLVCSNGDTGNPNGINPKITVGANKRVTFTYYYDSHQLLIEYAPSTITFDLQGHGEIPSQSVKVGGTITRPADPITNDYIFVGWYTDAECTQAYDFNTIVNDNLTLYAKWEEKYRLAYVETLNGTTQVFHPSHWITPSNSPRQDTISLYVKPFERKNSNPNPNTCQVWLEKYKYTDENGMVWEKKTAIDIRENASVFESNGVYNFVLVQDENGISVPTEKITPYDGNYYIRIGLNENYRSEENQFRFSDYASKYDDRFDHYFCKYIEQTDVRFCVACDYSACVSDTLVQEPADDPHHAYTDENGTLLHYANVRFMWNSENNHIDRDYLARAGENVHLLSEVGIFTSDGSAQATDVVLVDREDWLYQADVTAETLARVKLYVKPYDGAPKEAYQYLKGAEGDYSDANTIQLIGGTNGKTLKVRVIYDFKSNHLICAWLPEANNIIEGELSLQSDLILIREAHEDAQQITFKDEKASIIKVSQAYGVISLPKTHFESVEVSDNAKKFYWISFPYDVHLSEVFSVLTYGTDYVVKYYDGASRAAEGCWIDSPSFWKMYRSTEGVTLKKGVGYLLHVNINNISRFFENGNTDIKIYFPSANTDSLTISGEIETVTVPEHTCTIQRDHRYIYDSNWNLIGVPTWANVNDMNLPGAKEIDGISVRYLYDYIPESDNYNIVEAKDTTFRSMKAYMVQFAGTINWKDKTMTPSQKPLRAPAATVEQTIRLDLLRGEEALDHTFVQLSEAEGITNGFDLNNDLTKIQNSGSNLYLLIGSEQIEAAANILPYSEQTVYVPLGVIVDRDGAYTFALPEEMEGMDVRIADAETGYSHNLLLSPYEVALTAGTYTQRFSLEIHASSNVTTGCTETNAAGERLRKLLLDGHLFIQRGEKVYDAQGRQTR
ncbi:MAG: InlB B-repeat-containing protein [Paludibacteraceae bacterium]